MTDPRDTAATFDRIAPDLASLLVRLDDAITPDETLAIRDRVTATLTDAGLRWSDVAARVAAPSPAQPKPGHVPPPAPPEPPVAEVLADDERLERFIEKQVGPITAATVLTNEDLEAFGYRSLVTPIPGANDPKPAG